MGISGSKPKIVGDEKLYKNNPKKQIAEAKPPLIIPYTKAEAAKRVLESLQNWEGITKEANLNEDGFPQKQLAKLHNGVFLNQKRQASLYGFFGFVSIFCMTFFSYEGQS